MRTIQLRLSDAKALMKALPILLAGSLIANAGLLATVAFRPTLAPRALQGYFSAGPPTGSVRNLQPCPDLDVTPPQVRLTSGLVAGFGLTPSAGPLA